MRIENLYYHSRIRPLVFSSNRQEIYRYSYDNKLQLTFIVANYHKLFVIIMNYK